MIRPTARQLEGMIQEQKAMQQLHEGKKRSKRAVGWGFGAVGWGLEIERLSMQMESVVIKTAPQCWKAKLLRIGGNYEHLGRLSLPLVFNKNWFDISFFPYLTFFSVFDIVFPYLTYIFFHIWHFFPYLTLLFFDIWYLFSIFDISFFSIFGIFSVFDISFFFDFFK